MKKGFTLIELLAVIVIVAIIATIGVFTITKIMNNARMDSLKDTAYAVRKASKINLPNENSTADIIILDMTPANNGNPAGAYAYLLEVSKDPWGGSFIEIKAEITRLSDAKYRIDIYLTLSNGQIWVLEDESDELVLSDSLYNITNVLLSKNVRDLTLTWSKAKSLRTEGYVLEYDTNYNFTSPVIINTTNLNYTINNLPLNNTYYFRIRSKFGASFGDWSAVTSAKIFGANYTQTDNNINIVTTNTNNNWTIKLYGDNSTSGIINTSNLLATHNVNAGTTTKNISLDDQYVRYRVDITSEANASAGTSRDITITTNSSIVGAYQAFYYNRGWCANCGPVTYNSGTWKALNGNVIYNNGDRLSIGQVQSFYDNDEGDWYYDVGEWNDYYATSPGYVTHFYALGSTLKIRVVDGATSAFSDSTTLIIKT